MAFISCYDFETNNISRTSQIETQLANNIIISKEMNGNMYKPCNHVSLFPPTNIAIDIFIGDTDQIIIITSRFLLSFLW
jgi:hypothetical protein